MYQFFYLNFVYSEFAILLATIILMRKKNVRSCFTFGRLLNTSLYTIFSIYPCSCLSLFFIKIFSPSCNWLWLNTGLGKSLIFVDCHSITNCFLNLKKNILIMIYFLTIINM